jgi:hypothetical protein
MGGHVLRETTSRGQCGLGCPSHTSERGGEGEEKGSARGSVDSAATILQQWPVVCVCLLLQYLIQSCARGGRRIVEDMCYEI